MGLSVPCFFSFVRFVFCLCFLHHLAVSHHFVSSMMRPFCHDDERSALLKFKQSFVFGKHDCWDPISNYPKVESWKLEGGNSSSADCCSWNGVKCDEETGHVISLNLSSSCLRGSINSTSTLFKLVHLQWLSLAYNDFDFSEIPATINNLSRLTHLDLSHSVISGQIPPQLLDLRNLVSLDLSNNGFIGIPGNERHYLELGEPILQNLVEKLTNLKVLCLDQVNISSPIPHILANLSSLTYLSLQDCRLQGEFPTKIFQLPNLSVLQLSYNSNLTGYLPEFERSSPLTALAIGDCGFYGTIPSSLGNLTKLVYLYVPFNSFLGELPNSIGNLASLKELDLQGYNFSSQIVSSILGNLTQLDYLDLSHSRNKFSSQNSSSLSWIAKITKLKFLDLSDLNLVGEIPLWLMNLTQLTSLDMSQNQLTGPIPSCLMNINQLSFLHLQSNQLTRNIPSEISNLTQLVELDLSSNSLQGPIPRTIFEHKNLQYLMLQFNNLSGTVEFDMFLSQLERLETLILSSNNLSVFMNNTVANTNPHKFISIGLRSCNLISEFPNFLRNQYFLRVLDLSSNSITGKIPGWFLNDSMHHLQFLNLSHNLFTEFDQHPNVRPPYFLTTLDVRYNKLEGPLPVIPSKFMSEYLVSNNKLTGEISPSICKSKYLYALDLSNNNLNGVLPQCLANFSDSLSILALQSNNFHGSIPQTFMNGNNLKMIDLSNNQLQGTIPRSLVYCTKLEYLHLGNNQITDIFPSWLGILQELKILILKSNRLHGVIKEPEANFEFHKLHVIDLSHNMFRGELPTKHFQSWNAMKFVNVSLLTYMQAETQPNGFDIAYANWPNYAYSMKITNKGIEMNYGKIPNMLISIILSGNKFEGEIPASIASLRCLHNLNLSHNNLEGHIPSCLGNLTALESLDLSSNWLSGYIPQQLVEITYLEVFNVSYNHLTGLIPQGKQFDTFDNSSYHGNPGLYGKPLSNNCETSKPSKKENEDLESPFVFDWKIVLIGFSSGLIVGVVLGQEFYTRKHEWLAKFFGMQSMKRKRGRKN